MKWNHCKWEKVQGLRMLRLCGMPDGHPGKDHWPRIVVLDLSAKQFRKFQEDPLKFTIDHELYPDQPIQLLCDCVKLPMGDCVKKPRGDSRWTLIFWHGRPSSSLCMAGPQSCDGDDDD